jgi:hypothetical protein
MKRRTAKAHDNPVITPEMVELFRRGLQLQALGADEIADYGEDTPEQNEYSAIERRLHWQLLGLACDLGPLDVRPGEKVIGGAGFVATAPRALRIRETLMKELRRSGGIH